MPVAWQARATYAGAQSDINAETAELRAIFNDITESSGSLDFASFCQLPEVAAPLAVGDITEAVLEGLWLEAVAISRPAAPSDRESWGVCTPLSFDGFLELLRLAETSIAGENHNPALMHAQDASTSNVDARGVEVVRSRSRLIGFLRAAVTVHYRGAEVDQDLLGIRPEELHAAAVRAALELGLGSRETAEELQRKGVLKPSGVASHMEHELAKSQLAHQMKVTPSRDELVAHGVLLEATPTSHQLEVNMKKDLVKHGLAQRHTPEELIAAGVLKDGKSGVERAFICSKISHDLHHRRTSDELKAQGIMVDAVMPDQAHMEHMLAASQVSKRLSHRPDVEDVKAAGVYQTSVEAQAKHLEHEMAKDTLRTKLDPDVRPLKEDLESRGLLLSETPAQAKLEHIVASRNVKHGLENRESLEELKTQGIYPSVSKEASALERGLAARALKQLLETREPLEAVRAAGIYQSPMEAKMAELEASLTKDALKSSLEKRPELSDLEASNIYKGDSEVALRLDRAMKADAVAQGLRRRPSLEEAEAKGLIDSIGDSETAKHEAMKRRQNIMSEKVQHGLEHREPLEYLVNKGILIDQTPQEQGVERAFVQHKLAHDLAHRVLAEELQAKGVLLDLTADELREQHREARNALEGALSTRPSLQALEESGYLEVDECEELYRDLCGMRSELPAPELLQWGPVREMVASGSASEKLVQEALRNASPDSGLSFIQFLAFIHTLDLAIEGAVLSESPDDGEEVKVHKRHVSQKRERARNDIQSLTALLESHLRSRPARTAPETQRLGKGFQGASAVELEGQMLTDNLARSLRARESLDELKKRGIYNETTLPIKELEFAMNRRLLEKRLDQRSEADALLNKGVLHSQTPQQEHLEHLIARDSIKHSLERAERPSVNDLQARGIYRNTTAAAVSLEHKLQGAEVSRHLHSRPSLDALESRGILHSISAEEEGVFQTGHSALELSLARKDSSGPLSLADAMRLTPHMATSDAAAGIEAASEGIALHTAEERAKLIESGILREADPCSASLERHLKQDIVKHALESRDAVSDLRNRGIYIDKSARQRELERLIVQDTLSHKLQSKQRPTLDDLRAQGIYLGMSGPQHDMEKYLASRNVKHALERRESIEDVKAQGIYLKGEGGHEKHEKLLRRALLSRGLSHHFQPDELEQLKQKGIYKEGDQTKLKAERNLITSQLSRLINSRPSENALQEDLPHILESNQLAMLFEEAAGEDAATVSLEKLTSSTSAIASLIQDSEREIFTYFDVCDHDGDGEITFSEFLRFVDLCDLNPEDHIGVDDVMLEAAFAKIISAGGDPAASTVSLDQATTFKLLARWISNAQLDRKAVDALFAGNEGVVDQLGFISFCRRCEAASAHAHALRLEEMRASAKTECEEGKVSLKNSLLQKLTSRPVCFF